MSDFKDYYKILGVEQDASLFEIQQAYKKAALQHHPERQKSNHMQAQRRFSQISEAFNVLSDNEKRFKYDEMLHKGYSLGDADKTFEKFFDEHDFINEEESKFFNKHFPQRPKSSYEILGVHRNATLNDIKNAYRKLALQYHPRNNNNSKQSQQKFIEINKAYNDISDPQKRQIYDEWLYGQVAPIKAHNTFEDFYKYRPEQIPSEESFFKPLLKKKWSWGLDKMMEDQGEWGSMSNGEAWKESTVYSNNNGIETKKLVRTKKRVVNGKAEQVKTEEYLLPTGEREFTRTIESEGQRKVQKYTFNKGQQIPKQLLN